MYKDVVEIKKRLTWLVFIEFHFGEDKAKSAAFTCSKFNNRNTRKKCEIYSKLPIKAPEQHH